MKTKNYSWSIKKLVDDIGMVEFPEYQREPTVWKLPKKQRLIDSILRGFDIAPIYLFKKSDDTFDCIDGRQRINAILSYLGKNEESDFEDNGFHLKITNEIFDDDARFNKVDNKRFAALKGEWPEKINNYKLNIIEIREVEEEEELNLLFLRLQLGSVLNAGEKLHAMTGDMRDYIFDEVSKHKYFNEIKIPYRRYAREQVAAQIVLNFFSKKENGLFHRSRYLDLQDFFKQRSKFVLKDKILIKEIKDNLDLIEKIFRARLNYIGNRAIAVSVFLFVSEMIDEDKKSDIEKFADFFVLFLKTLKWQIPRGVQMDRPYHELLKFQTNITQAAGERSAVQKRHDFWQEYFHYYLKEKVIKGDKEYLKSTSTEPDLARNKI